jgi:hypothetical protein
MAIPSIKDRTWYDDGDASAFLVYAPISFGHTQLKVTIDAGVPEEQAFSKAASSIAVCVQKFRNAFATLDLNQWSPLSEHTKTTGSYVKTLILRSSAVESRDEYKVHLVPCYSSHLREANEAFWASLDPQKTKKGGGLLHWIGTRERSVDSDTANIDTAEARINSFRLVELAAILRGP